MHEYQRDAEYDGELRDHTRRGGEPPAHEMQAVAAGRVDALTPDAALRMQRYVGNAGLQQSVQRSKVHDVVSRSGGSPIPEDIVGIVESNYGPMPAGARMHTDDDALQSAKEVGAYAYASGRDIVVPPDAPREVQLEEAFHLAQQVRHSDVAQNDLGNGVLVSDDSDRYEQEAQSLARQHASAPAGPASDSAAYSASPAGPGADGGAAAVQRSVDGEPAAEEDELLEEQ